MEVHHHAHTSRKKWTDYLWEFLMLFFAVFCGFLAEYGLEHKIESDREQEYMASMVQDLTSDTIMLNDNLAFCSYISKGLDSLSNLLYQTDKYIENTNEIYRLNATYQRLIGVKFNTQTITQLRNSGNMRLVKKINVSNNIARYWIEASALEELEIGFNDRLNSDAEYGYNIFNQSMVLRGKLDSFTSIIKMKTVANAKLMTYDKNMLINYANRISRRSSKLSSFLLGHLIDQKTKAIDLILQIKKEYHLN